MKLDIRLFGPLAEAAGHARLELDLDEGATVRDVLAEASRRAPELGSLLGTVAVAVNRRYAAEDSAVAAGDEVALIPPVSGG